jgi:hypothetical protein
LNRGLLDQACQNGFYDRSDEKYENKIGRSTASEIIVFCFRHWHPRRGERMDGSSASPTVPDYTQTADLQQEERKLASVLL